MEENKGEGRAVNKGQKWFKLYADQPKASNLSIAGGAVKLLSIFLMVAAILYTLALLLSGFRIAAAGGIGTAFIFLMDELDDQLFAAFLLWGMVAGCRYVASVLQEKADLLGRCDRAVVEEEPVIVLEQETTVSQ